MMYGVGYLIGLVISLLFFFIILGVTAAFITLIVCKVLDRQRTKKIKEEEDKEYVIKSLFNND